MPHTIRGYRETGISFWLGGRSWCGASPIPPTGKGTRQCLGGYATPPPDTPPAVGGCAPQAPYLVVDEPKITEATAEVLICQQHTGCQDAHVRRGRLDELFRLVRLSGAAHGAVDHHPNTLGVYDGRHARLEHAPPDTHGNRHHQRLVVIIHRKSVRLLVTRRAALRLIVALSSARERGALRCAHGKPQRALRGHCALRSRAGCGGGERRSRGAAGVR